MKMLARALAAAPASLCGVYRVEARAILRLNLALTVPLVEPTISKHESDGAAK